MFSRVLLVKVLLWYNVLSLAIWVGGTVYQMLVVVPMWSAAPPESVTAFFKGTAYMTTIGWFFGPVTQALRALPLLVLTIAVWKLHHLRPWVLACAGTMMIGLIMTRALIYPMNDVLFAQAGAGLSADAVRALVQKWIWWDRVRFAVMSGGYICLLRAFALPLER